MFPFTILGINHTLIQFARLHFVEAPRRRPAVTHTLKKIEIPTPSFLLPITSRPTVRSEIGVKLPSRLHAYRPRWSGNRFDQRHRRARHRRVGREASEGRRREGQLLMQRNVPERATADLTFSPNPDRWTFAKWPNEKVFRLGQRKISTFNLFRYFQKGPTCWVSFFFIFMCVINWFSLLSPVALGFFNPGMSPHGLIPFLHCHRWDSPITIRLCEDRKVELSIETGCGPETSKVCSGAPGFKLIPVP